MEREQIIKALEYCNNPNRDPYCPQSDCPYGDVGSCEQLLRCHALTLIKELTEERKGLENLIYEMSKIENRMSETIEELTEENERLRNSSIDYRNIPEIKAKERADTVRKMQSEIEARCIKGGIYPAFIKRTIDQIAKEMIGEKND